MPLAADGPLGERVALGVDPDGESWTVQINQPTAPKTHNVRSAVALSPSGRPGLVRQGALQPNRRSPNLIEGEDFRRATGLEPLEVYHNGAPSPRTWYLVCWLDETAKQIRRATHDFVERCEGARALGTGADALLDEQRFDELLGRDESDASHVVAGKVLTTREIVHVHAAVSRRLRELFKTYDLWMIKPRHRAGYEIDGFVAMSPKSLLIEIKTSADANAMHTGVGQLTLYPLLLPRRRGARKILLTLGRPRDPLVAAIQESGVELHSYTIRMSGKRVRDVTFSPAFLAAVGLTEA
jgi:hypothetical protein